jgi:hypothetical protein
MKPLKKPLRASDYWPKVIFDRHVRLMITRVEPLNASVPAIELTKLQCDRMAAAIGKPFPKAARRHVERGMSLLIDDIIEGSRERSLKDALALIRAVKAKATKLKKISLDLRYSIGAKTNVPKNRLFSHDAVWMLPGTDNRWSSEVSVDALLTLCEKGLAVNRRRPVDLFLVVYFWFIFEAGYIAGLSNALPSNESKGGSPTNSELFKLSQVAIALLVDLARVMVRHSRLTDRQFKTATSRIDKYEKMRKGGLIDRLRQAKEMQDAPDLEVFASEVEQGYYR